MSNNEAADLIMEHLNFLLRIRHPRASGKSFIPIMHLMAALHRAVDILRVTPDKEDLNE